MSICRKHPMALNDGKCIDCIRLDNADKDKRIAELEETVKWDELELSKGSDECLRWEEITNKQNKRIAELEQALTAIKNNGNECVVSTDGTCQTQRIARNALTAEEE